jgi:hypothetical protein
MTETFTLAGVPSPPAGAIASLIVRHRGRSGDNQ